MYINKHHKQLSTPNAYITDVIYILSTRFIMMNLALKNMMCKFLIVTINLLFTFISHNTHNVITLLCS